MMANDVENANKAINHIVDKKLNEPNTIGRRRQLIRTRLTQHAIDKAIANSTSESHVPTHDGSEYKSNFCNSSFLPFEKNVELRLKRQEKYPLYGSAACTIYQQKAMAGVLKSHDWVSNLKEPFRKNSIITVSPEDDLRNSPYLKD